MAGLRIIPVAIGLFVAAPHFAGGKLITGLAPCPNGVPPARECLVSVLVDLRAFRARARGHNASQPLDGSKPQQQPGQSPSSPGGAGGPPGSGGPGGLGGIPGGPGRPSLRPTASKDLQANDNVVPEQDIQVATKPYSVDEDGKRKYLEREEQVRREFLREQQEQNKKQYQLEQAVRFQEDELQQLREQVQELRLQLAQALQLYQLTQRLQLPQRTGGAAGNYYQQPDLPPPSSLRRFYRTPQQQEQQPGRRLPLGFTAPTSATAPLYGERLSLRGLREIARSEVVVAS